MDSKDNSEEIDFQKYWLVLKRRWSIATVIFGAILILTSLQLLKQKSSYEAKAKIIFREDRTSTLTGVGEELELGELRAIGREAGPLQTQAEIIKSTPVTQEVIQSLSLDLEPQELADNLNVEPITGTDVLEISYKSKDPDLSTAIVNKIIDVYLNNHVQFNRAETRAASDFIRQQLPANEAAVREAESALRQFKEANGIIALPKEADSAVSILSSLDSEIAQAQAQLAKVTARSQVLQSQVGLESEQAVVFTALSQSPGVQEVLIQLQTAQAELSVEQTRYRDGHPAIDNLERRVEALNTLLQDRIEQVTGENQQVSAGSLQIGQLQQGLINDLVQSEADRAGLLQQIATLSNTQAAYRQRASSLPKLEQAQRELERRLQAAQITYETLLTRLQELQVAENQNIGNARALSSAVVSTIKPNKKLALLTGGGVGILLAIASAFTADLLDRSVKTLKESRDLFGYTLLTVIPAFGGGKRRFYSDKLDQPTPKLDQSIPRVVIRDLPFSAIAEAYQMLQANLKFLSSDKPLKTIVVTSSVAHEGKSEIAANLAVAMAQIGRRVLLVDTNLRHPVQHHVWDIVSPIGLTNVIVEQFDADVAVQEVLPNLFVLPAGVIPPNPIALLDSMRMAALVESLSNDYDFVIFDTPPLAGKADAAVLGKLTDGMLLVVRPGIIDSASASAAKEFLKQSDQHVLGMVINGVNVKSEPDSYFYYTGRKSRQEVDLALPPAQTSSSLLGERDRH